MNFRAKLGKAVYIFLGAIYIYIIESKTDPLSFQNSLYRVAAQSLFYLRIDVKNS
jgi:hypothetical protein